MPYFISHMQNVLLENIYPIYGVLCFKSDTRFDWKVFALNFCVQKNVVAHGNLLQRLYNQTSYMEVLNLDPHTALLDYRLLFPCTVSEQKVTSAPPLVALFY